MEGETNVGPGSWPGGRSQEREVRERDRGWQTWRREREAGGGQRELGVEVSLTERELEKEWDRGFRNVFDTYGRALKMILLHLGGLSLQQAVHTYTCLSGPSS